MITAFVPCRAGSERALSKNTRDFANVKGGLFRIKVDQLLACGLIDRIVVSTNDPEVGSVYEEYYSSIEKVVVVLRPEELCSSTASTDDLIKYVKEIIPEGVVLWTHVTSPFMTGHHYTALLEQYREDLQGSQHDSLMTVTELRKFIWNGRGPINYDRSIEKWPRTQTLEPLFEVNSAAFVIDSKLMANLNDRIGRHPRLYSLDRRASMDVDSLGDFRLAEEVWIEAARQIERGV